MHSVSFRLTSNDFVRVQRTYVLVSFTLRRVLLLFFAVWIIPVTMTIFNNRQQDLASTINFIAIVTMVGIGFSVLNIGWAYLMAAAAARKSFKQRKDLREELTAAWDDEQIEILGNGGHARRAFADFVKWAESDRFILLFVEDRLYNMLPIADVSPESIDTLRTGLRKAGVPKVGFLGLRAV